MIIESSANLHLQHNLSVPKELFSHSLSDFPHFNLYNLWWYVFINDYTSAEFFFTINLQNQRMMAIKVHWKPKWLKWLIFHRSIQTPTDWVKLRTQFMIYITYCLYINQFSRNTDFEDKLTTYCFHWGIINIINSMYLFWLSFLIWGWWLF